MRVTGIREQPIGISRYRDQCMPSGGLTTSLVAVVTDVVRGGQQVTGYGFASVGRYAQSGLIRERFAPRLLQAPAPDITTGDGANLDPFRAWTVMMTGEKPGGHGERCVAVGTLDSATAGRSRMPSAAPTAVATCAGSWTAANSANHTPRRCPQHQPCPCRIHGCFA